MKFGKFIDSLIVGALLLVAAGVVSAQSTCAVVAPNRAHVCWTAPTTNTDSTPITLPLTYNVQLQSGSTWNNVATGQSATDYTSGVLAAGTYVYRVLAIAGGISSSPSDTGSKTVVAPVPNAPTLVIIAATIRPDGSATYRVVYSATPRTGEVLFAVPSSMRSVFAAR